MGVMSCHVDVRNLLFIIKLKDLTIDLSVFTFSLLPL